MRRFKRLKDLELSLELKNPDFIAPPRESQRSWLVNRAINELVSDLQALDHASRRFVPGTEWSSLEDRSVRDLEDEEIMEEWQRPLMEAMARIAGASHGDVLEVGFGRGVSSSFLQAEGVRSHTILECNPSVLDRCRAWRDAQPDAEITIVPGLWQDTIEALGTFDAVFFHTYPLNEEEVADQVIGSTTFAEHFFPSAAAHLRTGGVFTYMTNEIDSLSRSHQRALLSHFSSISLEVISDLDVPEDTGDAWWIDQMVLVAAVK